MPRKVKTRPESEPFRLARSPSHLLHRAQQLAAERFANLARDKGLTLRQFAVLASLHENPGMSQSDLAAWANIDRSTLTDMLGRLEKRRLVRRTLSPHDARANVLTLEPDGAALFHSTTNFAKIADAAILDDLSKPKQRALIAALEALAHAADRTARRKSKKERGDGHKRA